LRIDIDRTEIRRATMHKRKWRAGLVLALIAVAGVASGCSGLAAKQPTVPAVKEQHALDLLKRMSDRLAHAKSFTFRSRSTIESPGGTGQLLNFFAKAEVAVERPNKLEAKVRGDAPPFDFYYNGSTMSVYAPVQKLYATTEAPKSIDEMLPFALKKAGILLPFDDVLYSDPYAVLTKNLTSAFYAGYSRIHGERCEHLAFASPGIQWQIWINQKTALPCLLMGALLDVQGAPRFAVEYFDWRLNPHLRHTRFTRAKPRGAGVMEFGTLAHSVTHSH
jgi:hypothetical protein